MILLELQLTPTVEGALKLRETTEPWKAGDTSAHGARGLWGEKRGCGDSLLKLLTWSPQSCFES